MVADAHWKEPAKPAGRIGLCAFEFSGAKEPGNLRHGGRDQEARLAVVRGEAGSKSIGAAAPSRSRSTSPPSPPAPERTTR
jgi:hypothetical protein